MKTSSLQVVENKGQQLSKFKPIPIDMGTFYEPSQGSQMYGYNAMHEYQHLVPKKQANYVFRREFIREYASWHNNPGELGFMIVGPTGSGKSTAVLAINAALNIPSILVSCHGDMTLLELKGTMQFVTDPATKQTVTDFVLGPLALAFKYGFTVILDENNVLPADVNAGINEIIRGNHMYIEQTGENIPRHPMFRIIATGNDWGRGEGELRMAGLKEQNSAYLNRWWKFEMGYPSKEEELLILQRRFPNATLSEAFMKAMVEVAHFIRPKIRGVGKNSEATLDFDFGTRTLIEWCDKAIRFEGVDNQIRYGLEIVLLRALDDNETEIVVQACKDKIDRNF